MNRIFQVLILTLAINFLAVAGGVGWLFASGKLTKEKLDVLHGMLFAPPPAPEVVTTNPATQPTTQPAMSKLDELLAKYSGRRAGEQVEALQQSVDAQAAALDRRSRELDNLMQQILREKAELARKSTALDAEHARMIEQENQQIAKAADAGFQTSLDLYNAMPAKKVKAAFLAMPDDAVVRFLQSMQPRTASKIISEFKAPDEQERINRILERMRTGGGPATRPSAAEPVAGTGSLASPAIAETGAGRPLSAAPPRE